MQKHKKINKNKKKPKKVINYQLLESVFILYGIHS